MEVNCWKIIPGEQVLLGQRWQSSACDTERCLMLTSWLVPLIWCLSGTVLCLPCCGKWGNLFVTFSYADRAQRREGSFLWVVNSHFPLICFVGVPFLYEWNKCQDYFLEKLNAIWKLNGSLHTCHIPMNNRVLLSQRPHSAQISFLKTLLQSGRLLQLIERYETLVPGSDRSVIKSFKTNVVTPWGTFLWC